MPTKLVAPLRAVFYKLSVGMPVHFIESMGSYGLQTHRVRAVDHTE